MPSIEAENPEAVKKLKTFFKEFSFSQLTAATRNACQLYQMALNRGLTPGGIVLNTGKQQKLHWFEGMEIIDEFWFYTGNTDNNTSAGWIALDKTNNVDAKSKMLINHQLSLTHGAVFFVPFDGRNTAELAKKFKSAAAADNVDIISWPDTWPLNKR